MTKTTRVDLSSNYSSLAPDDDSWSPATRDYIRKLPFGDQTFWGIPFTLGSVASTYSQPPLIVTRDLDEIAIPVEDKATFLVLAHFCDSRATNTTPVGNLDAPQTEDYASPVVTAPGEMLAQYVIVYEDGIEVSVPIRRRFEVNQIASRMQSGFAARPHQEGIPLEMRGPYEKNTWGRMQTIAFVGDWGPVEKVQPVDQSVAAASWSIYALPNPNPDSRIAKLQIRPSGAATIGIGGLTLFHGASHPLRHQRLETVAISSGDPDFSPADAEANVDMGVVARQRTSTPFDPDEWLSTPTPGWGEDADVEHSGDNLLLDVTANNDAILTVDGHELDVGEIYSTGSASSADGKLHARAVKTERTWANVKIVDAATGKPTPARVHFRSSDGRYFPPYGHRHEVNDNWFEDYGADLKLGSTNYAYADGQFPMELPVGDVYAEISKGFEYQAKRVKLNIAPGQRELEISLDRSVDLRPEGWITADSHTHFITPDTAWLEAQAEGINIINLLAAQWGDLYTNIGDITGEAGFASRDETVVWVGTENRQHFLGHISMLGTQGKPIFPMSTSGPTEGYFGDPTWRAMSEWADECRDQGGVVVVPHFPFPYSEVVAEVVRGRVDGVELRDFWTASMDTFAIHEWYRLLNCGYRVSAIGGTDKMSAGMPVGGVRTYANIGDDEFSFDAWGRAVRAGRTYTTSGPLLSLNVEGQMPGGEIRMGAGGGTVNVRATATSNAPINALQIVLNGKVVAEERSDSGTHYAAINEHLEIDGSGWIAARALSSHKAHHVWPVHFNAHTTPVYVVANRDELFDNPTAQYLITVMEGGLTWLDTLAIPATPERHAAVRGVFEEAIEAVKKRMAGDHTHAGPNHHSHHGHSDHSHGPQA